MTLLRLRTALRLIVVASFSVGCGQATVLPTGSVPPSMVRPTDSLLPTASPTPVEVPSPDATPSASTSVATPTAPPVFSDAEADLLENLRVDSRVGCAPRRSNLPPRATLRIECHVDDDLVDRVGVYGFPTEDGLGGYATGAYLARLEERGIALRSGDCRAGRPGDASWPDYLPDEGAEGAGPSEFRIGCFRDENGIANIRLTCYGDVYIGILGKDRDIAPLYAWAWRLQPGESPDRDPPGICARRD